jgi:predicted amidophosphoribosyltransferase
VFSDSIKVFRPGLYSYQSHKQVYGECSSKISDNCREGWIGEYRTFFKNFKENDGKLVCASCSRKLKNSGRSNPNCKYKFNDKYFKEIDTEEKAYFLGWIRPSRIL